MKTLKITFFGEIDAQALEDRLVLSVESDRKTGTETVEIGYSEPLSEVIDLWAFNLYNIRDFLKEIGCDTIHMRADSEEGFSMTPMTIRFMAEANCGLGLERN